MSAPSGRTSKAGPRGRLVATLLSFALVLTGLALWGGGAAVAAESGSGPTIASDQADYPPGGLVTLTGGGWQAGESVHVTVNDDQGRTWQRDVDLTADDAGTVTDSFNLPNWFVATYAVVATGVTSGEARASFTDSNLKVFSSAGSQTVAVNVSYGIYSASTICGSETSSTVSATSAGNTLGGVGAGDSVLLTAPATWQDSNGRHTFQGWSVQGEADSDAGATTRCVRGASGNKSVTARYSLGVPETVSTTTAVSTSAPSTYGDQVTFTATVSPSPSGAGTVTFTDGTSTLCSAATVTGATATCPTAALAAGTHTITASYSGAPGFTASSETVSQGVARRQVNGAFTAADKVYDGSTSATISSRSLDGVLSPDSGNVTLKSGTATFGTAAAGTGKTVTGTGFSLDGPASGNYVLASTTLTTTAKIGRQGVTVDFTAGDKEYDGTRTATITTRTITTGKLTGDDLTVSGGTATFGFRNAGTGKQVDATGFTLGGAAKDNYVVTSVTPATASITPKPVTGSFTAANKVYDRTTAADVTGRALAGVVDGDTVTFTGGTASFADSNVGTGRTVSLTGASLTGADAGNYTLDSVGATTADITARQVTGSFTVENKTYDGTTTAAIAFRSLDGVLDGDTVSLSGGLALFADKNAGTGKQVTGSGFTLTGPDAGNYTLKPGDLTATADIARRQVTGSFTAGDKPYDGRSDATVQSTSVAGAIAGDDVILLVAGAAFGTKNVGDSKTVVGDLSLGGADGDNYVLAADSASTSAAVTPRHMTATFTAGNKVYDATTDAEVTSTSLANTVPGDDVWLTGGTAGFADAAVGAGKVVTLTGATLTGADAGNYVLDSIATAKASIGTRALEVTAAPATKVYGEDDPALTYRVTKGDLVGGDTLTGSLTREPGQDVGSYAIGQGSLDAGPNYVLTFVPDDLSITPKALTVTTDDTHRTYGEGNPGFTVSYDGFVAGDKASDLGGSLGFSTDATKTSPVGPYWVTPSGLTSRNYAITFVPGTLTVTQRDLTVTAANATKTYGDSLTFDGSEFTTDGLVNGDTMTGVTLHSAGAAAAAAAKDYPIAASDAHGSGLGNYHISYQNGTLTVAKAPLTIRAGDQSRTYGDANPILTGNIDGIRNGDAVGASYSTEAGQVSGVGDYAITPAAVGEDSVLANYAITLRNGTLSVTKRSLTITARNQNKTYGDDLALGVTAFDAEGLANDDSVASVTLTSDGAAASAPADVYDINAAGALGGGKTSLGNYDVSYRNGTLTVKKAKLTVTTDPSSRVYGEENPGFDVSYDGFVNDETAAALGGTLTFATTAGKKSPVGNYDVAPSGLTSANYAIDFEPGTLTICRRGLTVTARNAEKTYGDTTAFTGGEFDTAGLADGDSLQSVALGSTGAAPHAGAGTYPIAASDAVAGAGTELRNYAISYVGGTLTVKKAPLTVTAEPATKVYGHDNPAFAVAYVGFVNDETPDVLGGTASYATSADGNSGVGSYDVTPSGLTAGSYEITFKKGTLSVTPAALTITPDDRSKTYGADLSLGSDRFAAKGLFNGDTVSVTLHSDGAPATAAAGSYPIAATDATAGDHTDLANYTISYADGQLTVGRAPLTITADDQSRTYGDANPTLTGNIGGIQNHDPVGASYSTTADQLSGVGDHAILPAAVGAKDVLANYDVALTAGTLRVTPRPLTITARNQGKTYGDELGLGTTGFDAQGLTNTDSVASVTLASNGAAATAPVGGYGITASGAVASPGTSLGNYQVSYRDGTLTVGKAPLTVTADNKERLLGAANPVFTGTLAGIRNGDPLVATYGTTADVNSPVGKYDIVPDVSGTAASVLANYTVNKVNATLSVMFRWDGFLQPINGTAHQTGLQTSQFKAGQTVPVKFTLKNAAGGVVTQPAGPTFRSTNIGSCGASTTVETATAATADSGSAFKWDGTQYQYNWSTKGLGAGLYRVRAVLSDGNQGAYVDVCLTK